MSELERTERLLGQAAMRKLADSRVAVFGVGGVGGTAVEALARSGVGTLDLIDDDRVSESNLNRQLLALHSTVGQYKADVAAMRIRDIRPQTVVHVHRLFYLPETAHLLTLSDYDYVIDAMDTVTAKLTLAERATAAGVPLISCMGTGNKLDPSALRVGDVFETSVCPLARVMRRELRKRGISRLRAVYSTEPPITPSPAAAQPPSDPPEHAQPPDHTRPASAGRRDIPGSSAFVPPAAGLLAASAVVRYLIQDL